MPSISVKPRSKTTGLAQLESEADELAIPAYAIDIQASQSVNEERIVTFYV
jgi:hypothetical protein